MIDLAAYRAAMEASAPRSAEASSIKRTHVRPPRGYAFMGMYIVPIKRWPTIAEIQARVAGFYHIPLIEMTSARRAREVARPRQVAMYLAKRLTPNSLPAIGRRFGGRDHTTVMHAVRQIEALSREGGSIAHEVFDLTASLSRDPTTNRPTVFPTTIHTTTLACSNGTGA